MTSTIKAQTPNEIYWASVAEEGARLLNEAAQNPQQPISQGSVYITTLSGPGAGRITEATPKLAAQATLSGLQRLSTESELSAYFAERDRRRAELRSKDAGRASRSL